MSHVKRLWMDKVNARRARALRAGFDYAGHRWDSDDTAVLNITLAASAVAAGWVPPQGFTWRSKANVNVPADAAFLTGLAAAAAVFRSSVYADGVAKKAAIDAATTHEQIYEAAG